MLIKNKERKVEEGLESKWRIPLAFCASGMLGTPRCLDGGVALGEVVPVSVL